MAAGLPARWVAFDEVYGRSEQLRTKAARAGLAYVAIIPRDYPVSTPAGTTIRADQAVAAAIFEPRSCGNGSKGPRYSDWALTATGITGQCLLIRRLISRPDQYTFYLCWAPSDRPATMTYFITIAGRRWPVEKTFKTGKDVLGWDQSRTRSFTGICRHTTLAALAQLRAAAIQTALAGRARAAEPAQRPCRVASSAIPGRGAAGRRRGCPPLRARRAAVEPSLCGTAAVVVFLGLGRGTPFLVD